MFSFCALIYSFHRQTFSHAIGQENTSSLFGCHWLCALSSVSHMFQFHRLRQSLSDEKAVKKCWKTYRASVIVIWGKSYGPIMTESPANWTDWHLLVSRSNKGCPIRPLNISNETYELFNNRKCVDFDECSGLELIQCVKC